MRSGPSPSSRRTGVWLGIVVGVCSVALVALPDAGPPEGPSDPGPLAPPDEPATTITGAPPVTAVLEPGWLLGLQTRWDLWGLDPVDGSPVLHLENFVDAAVRGDTVIGRRPGELLAGPHIDEVVELADQQFVEWVTPSPTMAFTPRPVLLVPTVPEEAASESQDLVLSRRSLDGSGWSDVTVNGCGWGYPITAQTSDLVFAIWCVGTKDLRVFVGDHSGVEETRFGDISDEDRVGPAILARGDKPLLVDSTGQIWTLVLSQDPYVSASGSIDLEEGEIVAGIAALTSDFRMLVVGITNTVQDMPTFSGRVTASRLLGFDLIRGRTAWKESSPTPIESIVAAPDGLVYGYRSAPEFAGGDLISIDPANGDIDVIATDLGTDPGRLLILPSEIVRHLNPRDP